MELVYTNGSDDGWVDQGVLRSFKMDLAYGADENDFEIAIPLDVHIPARALVYVEGTEWGGMVTGHRVSTYDGATNAIKGLTWHGVLSETYILPPEGETHFSVSGELNAALRQVIEHVGLGYLFQASPENSGISVSHTFDRFTDAYSGISEMLAANGMKLKVEVLPNSKPCIYAVEAGVHIDEEGDIDYEIVDGAPYNHIICIGKGGGEERIVLNLYADARGNVSANPTFYGAERRTYRYELSAADEESLTEKGAEKLKELQADASSCDLRLPDGRSYDVGDTVGVVDEVNGITVTASVTKVVVTISESGDVAVSNEVGNVTARRN